MKGLTGMDRTIFTCSEKVTLKLNTANNTSFLLVHAYKRLAGPFLLSLKLY